MKHRVLLSAPYMIPEEHRYRQFLEGAGIEVTIANVRERLAENDLLIFAGHVDGVICGDDCFTATVLERYVPRLKVISKWGTGLDSIDLDTAMRLGVKVYNTAGAFTDCVADSVMGYVLAFARRLPEMDRAMKAGEWSKLPARALNECTLGIIGVGRIGKAVLQRAKAFSMRLLGTDIIEIDPGFVGAVGVQVVSLEQLLRESDFVSLNCDLNPSSRGLINAVKLGIMRNSAVLINSARGPVVVEKDLIEALQSGRLAGAALDVFEEEPLPADSPLREMDNVLLAPHNANSSPSGWERVHWNTIRNLFLGLGLEPPKDVEEAIVGAATRDGDHIA